MTRYAMAIDAARCVGCMTCVVACQHEHALRPGVAWLRVDPLEWGSWPDAGRSYLPHGCFHCDDAPCARVCPTGATSRRDDGIVDIDYNLCIGCGVCIPACPYGARTINCEDRWFFDAPSPAPYENPDSAKVGVAEKCDLCLGRLNRGLEPACVAACPLGVRCVGDLDNPAGPLAEFASRTGACQVAGTGFLYTSNPDGLDVSSAVMGLRRDAGDGVVGSGGTGRSGSPAFLVASVAAGVAFTGGVAALALHERRKR